MPEPFRPVRQVPFKDLEDQGPPFKQLIRRLRAIDVDVFGNLYVAGEIRFGQEDVDRIEVTSTNWNRINFYHEGNASALFNTDQPGQIVSTAVEMRIEPAHDDDEKYGRITLNVAGGSVTEAGVEITDEGDTGDTHLQTLLELNPNETDTFALRALTNKIHLKGQGLYSDQSSNALPLSVYDKSMADYSPSTTNYETVWTVNVGDVGTTYPVRVRAWAYGTIDPGTTPVDVDMAVRISEDGGSTFDEVGEIIHNRGLTDSVGFACIAGLDATPTGNIQVQLRADSSQTDVNYERMSCIIEVTGDI